MAAKELNPMLKLALELGPLAVFFLVYRMVPADPGLDKAAGELSRMVTATAVFVPTVLAALAVSYVLTRHLPRMAALTAVVVAVFGGLTIWLQDDTFIKMKPTILYGLFALILGFGLLRGRSWLEYLMGELMPMRAEGWRILTLRFTFWFLAVAVLNEAVWRNVDTDTWVNFRTFVLPLLSIGFLMSQMPMLSRHMEEKKEG